MGEAEWGIEVLGLETGEGLRRVSYLSAVEL